ncbi:MAG TPA: hypothetical protein VFR23_04175 [Jiangellaceae bacterium]|nr:hypothetical protein [Jiangellaceae bacterium]
MAKFEIGDKVRMPGVPFIVEVLEIGTCEEAEHDPDDCEYGGETFRFTDPESGEDDWMHTAEFERV